MANFEPIGLIHSSYKHLFGIPRQGRYATSNEAVLEILKPYSLKNITEGLEGFSHVWLIFVFHRNRNKVSPGKVHPPRLGGKKMGVLATRSPHRPNPIGLTCSELIKVEKDRLYLRGVDLVDQTPVLDVKPYVRDYDSYPDAQRGWLENCSLEVIPVSFSQNFENEFNKNNLKNHFKEMIRECLELDPRPLVYKDRPERVHTLSLDNWEIDFKYWNKQFLVEGLRPIQGRSE